MEQTIMSYVFTFLAGLCACTVATKWALGEGGKAEGAIWTCVCALLAVFFARLRQS